MQLNCSFQCPEHFRSWCFLELVKLEGSNKQKKCLQCRTNTGDFDDTTVALIKAGRLEESFNIRPGATEDSTRRKPAAHSPKDTHFLSERLTQHRGGRGGRGPHTSSLHYTCIKAKEVTLWIIIRKKRPYSDFHSRPTFLFQIKNRNCTLTCNV